MQNVIPAIPTQELPTIAAVQAPVQTQQVQAEETGGCVMPFAIKEVTRLVIEFSWGFVAPEFEVVFIDHEGNLTIASETPVYNATLNRFEYIAGTRYVVIGKVAAKYTANWQHSITFRPETDDVSEEAELEEVEEPVKQPDVIVDTTDWYAASNNKKRRKAAELKAAGKAKADIHPALQPFYPAH